MINRFRAIIYKLFDSFLMLGIYLYNYFWYSIAGTKICIEASSNCQLNCVCCRRPEIENGPIGKGNLKFEDFKRFVNTHPTFRQIELSNYGEMFMNPELVEIIEYAYNKKIVLTADNGVNLNTVSDEVLRCLVKYQFKSLKVSIDGACNETYEIYRRGGNFHKVIDNIKKINSLKSEYNSKFPTLIWKFVVFGHNEHEISAAREMSKTLNMNFEAVFNCIDGYSPIKNEALVRRELGAVSNDNYRETHNNKTFMFFCNQFWSSVQINWDGKLLGCCFNKNVNFGNVFSLGLRKCLNTKAYREIIKLVTNQARYNSEIPLPCSTCLVYESMKKHNTFYRTGVCGMNALRLIVNLLKS